LINLEVQSNLKKIGTLVMLLLNGDCIEEMQKMIDEGVQVDSVVTDPPYELGFMGKSWDSTGIAFQKETWELAYQLLKPGGHLLAFSSSRTYHRMAVAIEDSGFEIRDQIMWLYGSGFPKSLNIGKAVDKKQGNDRVAVGERTRNVKPFDDDNGWNSNNTSGNYIYTKGNTEWEGWGTAIKPAHEPIVMARKPLSEKSIVDNVLKHGTGGINIDGCRISLEGETPPSGSAKRVYKNNQYTEDKTYGDNKTTPESGRFPANVMHDGLQEDWARYFYCPKTSKSERGENNNHPTVKPQKLMKYLCRLVTPKDGTVLDPFMGSGSTGMAAKDEGFDFIGIEQEKEYFEIADSRINITAPLSEFF
jgi:site-specific DNA-methyltransferase (adenine-specific)